MEKLKSDVEAHVQNVSKIRNILEKVCLQDNDAIVPKKLDMLMKTCKQAKTDDANILMWAKRFGIIEESRKRAKTSP